MKKIFVLLFSVLNLTVLLAQKNKGLTMEEFQQAKTFDIKDLDKDDYAKFGDNKYIVERYEDRKPYFITGDDGKKKRIDLYSLSIKGDDAPLGTMIYYTTETGKRYISCIPNNFSDGKVWEKYFEDIHGIDKVEPFFVLKLSYVLSKEFSYLRYNATLKGEEANRAEAGTYGNDICFPGEDLVAMADGSKKMIKDVQLGDQIVVANEADHSTKVTTVSQVMAHDEKNYALTKLTVVKSMISDNGHNIALTIQQLSATPNHPMQTFDGVKNIGAIQIGENIECVNPKNGQLEQFKVWDTEEKAGGVQKVYNLETKEGNTFIMNGVIVRQK